MLTYTAHVHIEDEDNRMSTEVVTRGHGSPTEAIVVASQLFAVRYAASSADITITITPIFNEEGL